MANNGILHRLGAPYHPQTNGLAERMVQSVKQALLNMEEQPSDLKTKKYGPIFNVVSQYSTRQVPPHTAQCLRRAS